MEASRRVQKSRRPRFSSLCPARAEVTMSASSGFSTEGSALATWFGSGWTEEGGGKQEGGGGYS